MGDVERVIFEDDVLDGAIGQSPSSVSYRARRSSRTKDVAVEVERPVQVREQVRQVELQAGGVGYVEGIGDVGIFPRRGFDDVDGDPGIIERAEDADVDRRVGGDDVNLVGVSGGDAAQRRW